MRVDRIASKHCDTNVSLSVKPEAPIATFTVQVDNPMKSWAIALRHFRRTGHDVFASGAYVEVELANPSTQRVFVRDVLGRLQRPEQGSFLEGEIAAGR